jgi:hypothetical protein
LHQYNVGPPMERSANDIAGFCFTDPATSECKDDGGRPGQIGATPRRYSERAALRRAQCRKPSPRLQLCNRSGVTSAFPSSPSQQAVGRLCAGMFSFLLSGFSKLRNFVTRKRCFHGVTKPGGLF